MGPEDVTKPVYANHPPQFAAILRVLSSPTRAAILRALAERPHTPAELARRVGVRDPTAREHLKRLHGAGLIRRREDERVWVYHELTPLGRRLLAKHARTLVGAAVIGFIAVMAGAFLLREWITRPVMPDGPPPVRPLIGSVDEPAAPPVVPEWFLPGGVTLVVLGGLVLLTVAYAWWRLARARKAQATDATT